MSETRSTPRLPPEATAAIARAEARRAILERLTEAGMIMVEAVVEQATATPGAEKRRADPAQAFAKLSRAVRMSIALETRLDEIILALRNGECPSLGRAGGEGRRAGAKPAKDGDDGQCAVRDPIQLAVWGAIDQTVADQEEALHLYDRVYERLFDRADYDHLDLDDFEGAVKAICADLGLEPDWSLWNQGAAFGPPDPLPPGEWRGGWKWDPGVAEDRRKRILAPPARSKAIRALARAGPFRRE